MKTNVQEKMDMAEQEASTQPEPNAVRIALVDEQPICRAGLRAVLADEADLNVIGSFATARHFIGTPRTTQPDVLIFDASSSESIPSTLQALRSLKPAPRLLCFSDFSDIKLCAMCMEYGVASVVSKTSDFEELIRGIRQTAAGASYIDPSLGAKMYALARARQNQPEQTGPELSSREEQVVRGLLDGRTNAEIASALNLSEKTIKHYVGSLKDKFNARNRTEVALAAQKFMSDAPTAIPA